MKRNLWIAAVLAAMLLCASCGSQGTAPGSSETPAPSGTELEAPSPSPSAEEYDFSGCVADPYTESLTGFEGLPWGTVMPDSLTAELGTEGELVLKSSVEFAGLNFSAERGFTPALADGSTLVMDSGLYVRNGYFDPRDMDAKVAQAVSDYNRTVAYLKELYGEPATGGGTLTVEEFTAEYSGVGATWDRDNTAIVARLSPDYGGMLMVRFDYDGDLSLAETPGGDAPA